MTPVYVALGLGVIASMGALAAVLSFLPAPPSNADVVEQRLRVYEAGPVLPTLEQLELQQPFMERVFWPVVRRIGRLVEQTMPERARQQVQTSLQLAGRPGGFSTSDFIAVRYVAASVLCLVGVLLGVAIHSLVFLALFAAIGAVIGLYGPMFWLRFMVNRRRDAIQLDLPDVIDVLVVCVEAGLTFEAAMERVVEKFDHALADEMGRVLQEIRIGRPRLEALNDLGVRTGVDDLNNFVQAIIQSEQLGAGVARILRMQSDDVRQKRLLIAQERGARASLKMLVPMIGCIFPTLWVILLGPAALLALHYLRGT